MWDVPRALACAALAASFMLAAGNVASATDRYRQLAHHLVVDVDGAKPGDVVLITTTVQNDELIEDLMIELRKAGAWPLVDLSSDRATKAYFDEVSPKYDSQLPGAAYRLNTIINSQINIDWEQDPNLLRNASPARQTVQAAAFAPVTALFVKRGIPYVEVGNGLFPSKYTAAQYGITKAQLAAAFWNGVDTPYAKVHANARIVLKAVAAGRTVRVTAPNGTDVTFGLKGNRIVVSDGALTPALRAKRSAIVYIALPAGEVICGPAPGTAQGTVVFGPEFFSNTEVDGMRMTFTNGRMTSMSAKSGLAAVKAFYQVGTAGRDAFTFADFGVNPGVSFVAGSKMFVTMAAGMVTLGTGGDLALGGKNTSSFNFAGYITGATVTIDGKPVIANGKLVP